MNNVLVPTDFSENAYQALCYAVKMFQGRSCNVHIVHSYESQVSQLTSRVDIGKSEKVLAGLYESVDKQLDELLRRVRNEHPDSDVIFKKASTGLMLQRAVERYCKKESIDLTIMGTKGQTGAREVLLGSNTIKVIKKSSCTPVLIIPPGTSFTPLKNIAFATDFKYAYTARKIAPLLKFQNIFDASILLVHVREEDEVSKRQQDNMNELMKILKDVDTSVAWLSVQEDKVRAINDFVYSANVDMLVMLYYRKNYLKHLLRGSVVKQIGRHPEIPYLVIPDDPG